MSNHTFGAGEAADATVVTDSEPVSDALVHEDSRAGQDVDFLRESVERCERKVAKQREHLTWAEEALENAKAALAEVEGA